jgi:glycerol-3-phosphate dehydrogenase (NAD(P)+)
MGQVGIIGAGSWGTALAKVLAESGLSVTLWCHGEDSYATMLESGENTVYLPGVQLPRSITLVREVPRAVSGHEMVVIACPSHTLRETLAKAGGALAQTSVLVSAVKGFEEGSLKTVTDFVSGLLPPGSQTEVAALSGPTFALEVAQGLPSAATVAAKSRETAERVQRFLGPSGLRLYTSDDPVGTQVGGAVKNVIAIACGVCDGLQLGLNARAALITRGLAEMTRLAVRLGGNALTLQGLPGVGDLVLTCTGELSRNKKVGMKLSLGASLAEVTAGSRMVAEGIRGARAIRSLARRVRLEMPIVEAVCELLFEGAFAPEVVRTLLHRPLRHELDGN